MPTDWKLAGSQWTTTAMEITSAVNNRKGAVKKRSQVMTKLAGITAGTKRNKKGGELWL
jgi:hypothetical protein